MKRVSFNVAKALKEAGYPQEYSEYYFDYNECLQKRYKCYVNCQCIAPYYLEVWLWLIREKEIKLIITIDTIGKWVIVYNLTAISKANDPEEAIIAAIEYLVENKLLK